MLDAGFVLITDDRGIIESITTTEDAGEDVQKLNGILSPGFINCHCHLELSHMRGLIPEKTGLVDFVFKVVTQRHFEEAEVLDAIEQAENEMLANGIVAAGDICNNTFTLAQKLKQRLAYYNFIEVSGWLPQAAGIRFERSKVYYDAFVNGQSSMVNEKPKKDHRNSPCTIHHSHYTSLVPHAPYSVSDELWQYMQPYFAGKTITMHNQEASYEDELFLSNTGEFVRMYDMMKIDHSFFKPTGKSSLQSYFQKLALAENVILVHNTFITEEDLLYVNRESSMGNKEQPATGNRKPVTFFCTCINANLYIESKVPPLDMLIKNNCKMVLGTDSLASNHSLSLLDEMKSITQHFPHIGLETLLQWATINGATALQMNDVLGSFEKGKQPGIVLIDKLSNQKLAADTSVRRLI